MVNLVFNTSFYIICFNTIKIFIENFSFPMAFAKTLKEKKLSIYCDHCFKDITLETYIRCEDCFFDSCSNCFIEEATTDKHTLDHSFRVISNLNTFMHINWRIIDILLLIDGAVTYGFGNFDDISKILMKSPDEVRRYFYKLIKLNDDEENESIVEKSKSNPNDSFVLSYMSKRKELDSEILNEYENAIENLQIEPENTDLEIEYKRHMLMNYKNVLKRRKIWRNFLFDRNLIDVKPLLAKDAGLMGEAVTKIKWISQFLSKKDFNVFVDGLVKEKELKASLARYPYISSINEAKLMDNTKLLSKKEHYLCNALNLDSKTYVKLKKMALEFYVLKKPLNEHFFDLFLEQDKERAYVIYKWFKDQNVVIE